MSIREENGASRVVVSARGQRVARFSIRTFSACIRSESQDIDAQIRNPGH